MWVRNLQIFDYQLLQKLIIGNYGIQYRQVIYNFIFYSKESFENIDIWLKELKTHANPDAKVFIIGNKLDLEEKRKVFKDQALKYKDDYELRVKRGEYYE